MAGTLSRWLASSDENIRPRALALLGLLLLLNIAAWIWALIAFQQFPLLLGMALLAYSLGLRHAVDADHIAAIDNVTRKLMQEGGRPLTVGLMFALGHSTVVILVSVLIAVAALAFQAHFEAYRALGGIVGTAVSSLFLLALAVMNATALGPLYRRLQSLRRGERTTEPDAESLMAQGPLTRLFRPLFRTVSRSWHMYPIGFLFGLGFDTAAQIGLLVMAASDATQGLPIWTILIFPLLFTAGMSLVDTADGMLMLKVYGWAFVKPIRKIYYNLTITLVSVIIALFIGGIAGLGLLAEQFQLQGSFWHELANLDEHLGNLGFAVIAIFVLAWIVSVGIFKLRRFDELEPEVSRHHD